MQTYLYIEEIICYEVDWLVNCSVFYDVPQWYLQSICIKKSLSANWKFLKNMFYINNANKQPIYYNNKYRKYEFIKIQTFQWEY